MEKTTKSNTPFIIAIIFLLVALLISFGIIIFLLARGATTSAQINSYADCAAAGYPILESYPEQCNTPDGKHFTRILTPEESDKLKPPTGTDSSPGQTEPSAPTQTSLKIYFSQSPQSLNNFTFVVPSNRTTSRPDIATFAIEQLIQGPDEAEQNQSIFTPIKLQGTSNCNGKDFRLTVMDRVAMLTFCRPVLSTGVGDDARISTTVEKTLLQFNTISKVKIFTNSNDCFGDQSGMNACKN